LFDSNKLRILVTYRDSIKQTGERLMSWCEFCIQNGKNLVFSFRNA